MITSRQPPNKLFRAARLRLKSAFGDGPPSREEFADRVNSVIDPRSKEGPVTANDIGKIERGLVSYPREHRRRAYRVALGAKTDAEIGLVNRRDRPTDTIPVNGGDAFLAVSAGHLDSSFPKADSKEVELGPSMLPAVAFQEQSPGAPGLTLDDLDRIDAVNRDARRYLDETLVAFLGEELDRCIADDGASGPRYALPRAIGVLSIIQRNIHVVKWSVHQPLLQVGSRAAEFTGWLYRDAGHPAAAEYWRDRASEWAMAATDFAMPGYILIKKSQAAWDARDAPRMLGLAEAVQVGPWRLPARIMAEAVQQQARGLAMLKSKRQHVDDTLEKARALLAEVSVDSTTLAAHYDKALFEAQVAICYGESGRPEEAAGIFEVVVKPDVFSARDYAYFSTLRAQTLAAASLPDDAASVGASIIPVAFTAGSTRTVRELSRLRNDLHPWRHRPAVASFMRLMQTL
ncbi:hypothetical protein FHR83_005452 [Actinoplanes campanulatus]|uniref:Uncharacterized protein n=1 Tax=Actinoplanes campanulatus TaxID=113559 RepID=A0A7W5AK47_9ACTN|nr:XRE family transcriptional regulator [Actinoplanes campanulatus]MBB3097768.1 hypothetical protein [Actinoplanes campanulatus]GGN38242.1 hypothetical protein GCM10010109_64920 [Actinoplanes campanulatus]GID39662.1 hypothetical protein Aca09nite_61680 [Actinoplanes campanulatus]